MIEIKNILIYSVQLFEHQSIFELTFVALPLLFTRKDFFTLRIVHSSTMNWLYSAKSNDLNVIY